MADRTGNRILDRLPLDESSRLLSSSQVVALPHGQEVYRQEVPHVYFPTTGVFGVVIRMEEGKLVEGTTVGNEGMVGLPAFLGVDFHPFSVVSQVRGEAVQVLAATFLQALKRGGTWTGCGGGTRSTACGVRTRRWRATPCTVPRNGSLAGS